MAQIFLIAPLSRLIRLVRLTRLARPIRLTRLARLVRLIRLFILFAILLITGPVAIASGQSLRQVPQTEQDIKMSFSPLVKQTARAVVNVYAERVVRQRSPFFEQFFGRHMPNRRERQSSLGSGVVIDPSGIVITNQHVIEGADDIRVAFSDGREYSSRILLQDERVDLAILQIKNGGDFPALAFGDSDTLEVGDIVLAIGNPFGVGQTVTSGIISALARNQVGVSDFGFFIQTDAAINPGNSGGALIDMDGKLIGINTAIFSRSGGSNGIGFAIPANMVRTVTAAALGGHDKFIRPFLGASFEPITSDIAQAFGLSRAHGALITALVPDSPAERAGLRPGDLVVSFNGQSIEHPDALGYRLATTSIGSMIELGVHSNERKRTVRVKLEPPPKGGIFDKVMLTGNNPFSGAEVAGLTPFLANEMKLPVNRQGIVILDIKRGSLAARYGFLPGDVIISVSTRSLKNVEQLEEILRRGARVWRLQIIRDGRIIRQILR